MTDVGTTKRGTLTPKMKLAVWTRDGGKCWSCGRKLGPRDNAKYEHVRALGLGGADKIDNISLSCEWCWALKNADDIPRIAKAKRVATKNIGAHRSRSPMQGGRDSKWKKLMNGSVVDRETGEPIR